MQNEVPSASSTPPQPNTPPWEKAPPPAPAPDSPPAAGYPPAPGYPAAGYPPPMLPGTNRLAVTALVGSIVGFVGIGSLLGLILGFVALREIKQRPQRGRELAIIAMVIGSITAVIGAALLPSYLEESIRDKKAGAVTVMPDELQKGDCILALDESTSVYDLPVVPCGQPHVAEVFHVFTLPDGDYPGEEAVEKEGGERCEAAFNLFLTEKTERLEITFLYPRSADWYRAKGVTCIAVEPNGTSTTSLVG